MQYNLTVKDVAKRWSVSVPTVWRWAAAKKIPAPHKIGANVTRWELGEIEAWEAKRVSQ